jgi:hypothetical protein
MHPNLGRNITGSIALLVCCDWSETSNAALLEEKNATPGTSVTVGSR